MVGSRFGPTLVWAILVGMIGICIFAQMSGRVAAISGRATFEIIRERLGNRLALANLTASFLINLLTLTAEVGGIALSMQLASGIQPMLWMPVAVFGVWIVIWRVKFKILENVTGLLGLALVVFAVAVFMLQPDWLELGKQFLQQTPVHSSESPATYWYFAIALFGSAMTPYEVFFFSSGAIEEKWTKKDITESRMNVLVGFPLGALLSISIVVCAALVLLPQEISVTSLYQAALPVAQGVGTVGLIIAILGFVAVTFGAALETTLASGYTLSQFFGWRWGKMVRPSQASLFHLTMIVSLLIGLGILLTGVDPVQVTEISVVFSAIALPLTYLPILIIANDPQYMGKATNGKVTNFFGLVYLGIILIAAVAAIPLLIITGAG